MNKKMLALYGLKWNPFAPDVPVEALHVTPRIESFCWRVGQLAGPKLLAQLANIVGCRAMVLIQCNHDVAIRSTHNAGGAVHRVHWTVGKSNVIEDIVQLFAGDLLPDRSFNLVRKAGGFLNAHPRLPSDVKNELSGIRVGKEVLPKKWQ